MSKSNNRELSEKPHPEKWSKKEILGHLIDSAINNLQRFTEIQYADKPYKIRVYDQERLVVANAYQQASTESLLALWLSLNVRIKQIIAQQPESHLQYAIELPNGTLSNFKFLLEDYVNHMEHHLGQILK